MMFEDEFRRSTLNERSGEVDWDLDTLWSRCQRLVCFVGSRTDKREVLLMETRGTCEVAAVTGQRVFKRLVVLLWPFVQLR